MRELDLLLERFLARDFDGLDDIHLPEFERLLEEPDQDILAWLSESRPAPPAHRSMVAKIRAALD